MENIPISFECEGKNYKGSLSALCGAGTHVYYLMIDKFYKARLRLTELHGWQFDVRSGECLTVPDRIKTYSILIEDDLIKVVLTTDNTDRKSGF